MILTKETMIWCVLSPDRGSLIRAFLDSEACRDYCDKLNKKAGNPVGFDPMFNRYKSYAKVTCAPIWRLTPSELKQHRRNGADDLATFISRIRRTA